MSIVSFENIDIDQKKMFLKSDRDEQLIITYNINLQGLSNDEVKTVNIELPLTDYACCRLHNPFLNAQSDVFKVRTQVNNLNKTVGYLFPSAALQDDEEDIDENFDEAKQAYKFYCIKLLIMNYEWNDSFLDRELNFSSLIAEDSSYLIVYKPLLQDHLFSLSNWMPSLALYGYFNFPGNSEPQVKDLINFNSPQDNINVIIRSFYLNQRGQQYLTLNNCKKLLDNSPLIKTLYLNYLIEAGNPLYRFLLLYQIIEFLIEKTAGENLDKAIARRDTISISRFLQEVRESQNTRSTINKLLDMVTFDEKTQITNALKQYIVEFDNEYDKTSTGDCLYDIRNLLFHDYKSILAGNRQNEVAGLIIHCELLMHHLVIDYSLID